MSAANADAEWPRFDAATGTLLHPDMSDTRGWSTERRDAANAAQAEFNAAVPFNEPCVACNHRKWHAGYTLSGDRVWCCSNCGCRRMSAAEWSVERAAERAKAERQSATAAATPVPTAKSARVALATAIAARDDARAELAKLEAASDPARATIAQLRAAHELAEAELASAEAGGAANVIAMLLGGETKPNAILRSAIRARLEDAAAELAAAVLARQQIGERLDAARSAIARHERKVRELAIDVLRLDIPPGVIARAERARAEFAKAMRAVCWLGARGVLADNAAHRRLFESASAWPEAADGAPAWEAALAELQRDASAALPA